MLGIFGDFFGWNDLTTEYEDIEDQDDIEKAIPDDNIAHNWRDENKITWLQN